MKKDLKNKRVEEKPHALRLRPTLGKGFLLIAIWCLTLVPALAEGPTFHSFLAKDLTRLVPVTSFSRNDRIYLYTTWTNLTGPHEIKVLWIRPDQKVQETTRFKVNSPPASWAWLSFSKGLLDLSSGDVKFIGSWKARLFLDGKFLKEYEFSVF
jgi:hypothetical protein